MCQKEKESPGEHRETVSKPGGFFFIKNVDLNDVFVRGVANLQVSECPYVFPISVNAISEERLQGISANLASRWTRR